MAEDTRTEAEGKEKQNEKIISVLIAAILIIALAACVPPCVPGGSEGATENSESDTDESETVTEESETDTEESETAESESETDETGSPPETEETETGETESEEISDTDFQPGNIPVVYIHIDGGDEEVQKMNESEDHSYRCTGTMDLYVPDGYQSAVLGTSSESLSGLEMEYIRGRGNSSWGADKKPYKIKLSKGRYFIGWYTEDNVPAEEYLTVNDNITLDARYIPLEEVTYIEDLIFEEEEIQVSMSDGIYQPGFTVLPEDAINKKIAWSVSDEELASVDEEGCVVLLAPGDVTLTATLHSGKTISCLIHIGEAEEE